MAQSICIKCGKPIWGTAQTCPRCSAPVGELSGERQEQEKVERAYIETQVKARAQEVVVTDINMPFGSMVGFMVKWAIAAIPALIILAVLWGFITMIAAAIVGS